ncbi:DUF6479 family protein [Streptomyces sp. NPDC006739]|uniref:DUF6479 family protein n=1 Tax=Streptomyces sp. NPDC006739 TaxID=3364763 RepID=UPI0036AA8E95
MNTATYVAAGAATALGYVAVLVAGLAITAGLVWAVRFGMRVRPTEHAHAGPGEHPTLPPDGPVRETSEMREPDEIPVAADESERLTPHQLNPVGTRRARDQRRPRWSPGSSGSFGGGGGGRT